LYEIQGVVVLNRSNKLAILIASLLLASCGGSEEPKTESEHQAKSEYATILEHLEETRKQIDGLNLEIAQLRKDVASIKTTYPNQPNKPAAPRIVSEVILDKDDPIVGNSKATVAIMEFSDFQCPFCARFEKQSMAKLKKSYIDTGKVKFISRDFPLSFHSKAKTAAIAANCALEQGAYEQIRTALYDNQRNLSSDLYMKLAKDMKLDQKTFTTCMNDPAKGMEIEADISYGQSIGVTGTPSFLIGKVKDGKIVQAKFLRGAQPYRAFAQQVDALLN
jgi:protein-disulfide isomerase